MIRPIAAILSAVLLVATSFYPVFMTSMMPVAPYDDALTQEPAQFAQRYLSWIDARRWNAVVAVSDRGMHAEFQKVFATMADMIPDTEPTAIHVVGVHTIGSANFESVNLTLEYRFPDKALLASFVMQRDGSSFLIKGVHIIPMAQSLEQTYEFHFLGQDLIHYVLFTGALVLILFNAYALVQCIMMPLRMKLLWIIFILVGFGSVQYNWTDAVFDYGILSIYIPTVRLGQLAYQSFMLTVSMPVGAIIFMLRYRALAARDEGNLVEYG